jgi:hypothetical protein
MDRQRSQAIEELQISNNHAICQKCGLAVPLLNNINTKPTGRRIETLRWRINWLQHHYHPESKGQKEDIKTMQDELAGLLSDDVEYEKLRNIPL